jgi:hypothetical protein
MILINEVARFSPNPFTYKDMSIRWRFGVAMERIKQQRALVKRALQHWQQLQADAELLKLGQGPGRQHVELRRGIKGNKATDPHGTDLLQERLDKDEQLSRLARTPARELAKTKLARESDLERRGVQVQRRSDARLARRQDAREARLQQRCLRLYLDTFRCQKSPETAKRARKKSPVNED